MNHFMRVVGLLLGLSLSSVALGASDVVAPAQAAPIKLGVLDWQRLIATAPQAKEATKRLQAEFQGVAQKLNDKQSDFQAKRTKLQRDGNVLSAAERTKKEKELAKLEQEIRRMDEELQSENASRSREEMDDFLRVVREVVEKLGHEQNYDAIFSQEVMAYASERIDVTDTILERLQKLPKSEKKSK